MESGYNFYQQIREKRISLAYQGLMSREMVSQISRSMNVLAHNSDELLARRVFGVLVELTQNIQLHSAERGLSETDNREVGLGIVAIGQDEDSVVVHAGNLIHNEKVNVIIELCNKLNELDDEGLKKLYVEQRRLEMFDENMNTTGFIDIARKSGSTLKVLMLPLDSKFSFFTISIAIGKTRKQRHLPFENTKEKPQISEKDFYVRGERFVPTIHFDYETAILEIAGQSYHEYTVEFYDPAIAWLETYLQTLDKNVIFNFRLTYFNTSASRRFLEMLDMLEDYKKSKKGNVRINWFYQKNDLDMLESGEEYADDVKLDFVFIPY